MRSSDVFVYFALFPAAHGFIETGLPSLIAGWRQQSADASSCRRNAARSMMNLGEPSHASAGASSRHRFVQTLVGAGVLGLTTVLPPCASPPARAAGASLEELEADLMLCKEVFKPTLQYLKAEQFDAARTNTNYITRFINLKKKIDAFIVAANEVVDDVDQLERAFDMAQEVEALFTNFDSSVYTIIFIPSDAAGVLPPGAEKYLKQAYGYYNDINNVLDFYISLAPAESKQAAEKLLPAKKSALPKFLFKEDSALMKEKLAISN
ncbi:unnamed protein product [Ascophyllum nodosum]